MTDNRRFPADALRALYGALRQSVDDALAALGPPLDGLVAPNLETFKHAERRAIQLIAEIVAIQDREARDRDRGRRINFYLPALRPRNQPKRYHDD